MGVERKWAQSSTESADPLENEGNGSSALRSRALQFADEETYTEVLQLLLNLGSEVPIQFQPMGDNDILLPEWSYRRLLPLLRERKVRYEELEVTPVSDLPPEEQAELRGLNWAKH